MNDSHHLDSVHLDSLRRAEFRRIRDSLLEAVGEDTQRGIPVAEGGSTLFHSLADRMPEGLDFVLLDKETVYQLKVGVNTIGRLSDNDVAIVDAYLSRRHCAILVHASGQCEIYDVASKNGTYVNGQKIVGKTPLKSGDELRMCDRQFIFLQRTEIKDELPGGEPPGSNSGDRTQTD